MPVDGCRGLSYLYQIINGTTLKLKKTTNMLLIAALFIGIAFHGSSIFFTLETTYDA